MYIYSIIRKDIPLADQIVQTAHSSFHAGNLSQLINCVPTLVLLEVENQEQLNKAQLSLTKKGISFYAFFEPDDDMGYTSITTHPVTDEQRKLFSNYRLWRA